MEIQFKKVCECGITSNFKECEKCKCKKSLELEEKKWNRIHKSIKVKHYVNLEPIIYGALKLKNLLWKNFK